MKHIKFVGKTKDKDSDDYNTPIEKVLPAHMIGLQRYNENNYWVEVHGRDDYDIYRVEEKEYYRIEKELLNEEELPCIPQVKTESPYDRMEVE